MRALKPEGNNYRTFYDITEHDVCQPLDETDIRNAYTTTHTHTHSLKRMRKKWEENISKK